MTEPYYADELVTIYHGDCRALIPAIPFDAVVTDPPYGTGGWRRSTRGAGRNPSGSLVREPWDDGAVDWLPAQAEAIVTFWPSASAGRLLVAAERLGFEKHRCLYMRKRDPKPQPAQRVRWSVEPIWVLSHAGYVLTGGEDIWEDSTPRMGRDADATGHPNQKPIEVMHWLIGKLSPGLILDPFAGSGTTLRAAKDLGRRAVGIEADEHWCEVAARRMAQEVLALTGNGGSATE